MSARGGPGGKAKASRGWLAPAVEYGPLAVFFLVYLELGLMMAIAALMAATAFALGLSFVLARKLPWVAMATAAAVGLFGGLALWLDDERFYKMKPTVVQAIFAIVLLGGLVLRRPLLKPLLGAAWPMDEAGWRRLSFRFGVFFAAMAALNEAVWRTQTTDTWVYFKVFGLLGLTVAFTLAQIPLMSRHRLPEAAGDGNPGMGP